MTQRERFLSLEDEQEIVDAIVVAENNTSGEVRIHIDYEEGGELMEQATRTFHALKMDQTKQRNGVLLYINVSNHTFAIIGDEGINKVVEPDFWDCTKDMIITEFKKGQFKDGLIKGVLNVGEKLKSFFPYLDDDVNELPNEISGLNG